VTGWSFGDAAPAAEAVVAGLRAPGWVVVDDAVTAAGVGALRDDLDGRESLVVAGVGRGDEHRFAESIRRDRIDWIEPDTAVTRAYLAWAEALRQTINRHLFLGLFEFEAHYASYPAGGFYRRHLDAFRGGDNRKVSTVLYLDDWRPGDGGELVVYEPAPADEAGDPYVVDVDPTTPVIATVEPVAGRLVVFLSEDFPHEVLPTAVERRSIAGWYRVA
jgi:SM-20-related protein